MLRLLSRVDFFKKLSVFVTISIFLGCSGSLVHTRQQQDYDFSFVFMIDIHLRPERGAVEGFRKAIKTVNNLAPDFVIAGGDLIMDAIEQPYERADSLYNLYIETSKEFKMPVYNTLGNHEIFGLYETSGVDPTHPEYGKKMYLNRIGKRYYSFDHKGWHFMVLDSVGETEDRKYKGVIDSAQMEWIKDDLAEVDRDVPIVISVHIPFITVATQLKSGPLSAIEENQVVTNSKETLNLFRDHNLKLVLQGHLHFLEDVYVNGIHFITGGAVCAAWWKGPNDGLEEGYIVVYVKGKEFDWEYIDYGWDAQNEDLEKSGGT
jgi:Icc-related predicted phosphoesterase